MTAPVVDWIVLRSLTTGSAPKPPRSLVVAAAILHGLARRTAPQTQGAAAGSRASAHHAQERPQSKAGASGIGVDQVVHVGASGGGVNPAGPGAGGAYLAPSPCHG